MKVIIPLAGEGTRMRPHTHTKPKPLLSVAGKPGLSYILDELKALDVSEIIFITGHLEDKVKRFVESNCSIKCRYVRQQSLDGTAGAVMLAKPYIDEPVLIVFVDTIFDADLGLIKKKDAAGIVWVQHVEDYSRFGVCLLDKDGFLTKIVEKPAEPISKLANIGLYYFDDYKLLFEGLGHVMRSEAKGEKYLTDAIDYMVSKGAKIICPEVSGWFDFGKPETLLESNRKLLSRAKEQQVDSVNSAILQPVKVGKGVRIIDCVVGPYVTIGDETVLERCVVSDSVIGERTRIIDCILRSSIIGDDVQVIREPLKLDLGDHSSVRSR